VKYLSGIWTFKKILNSNYSTKWCWENQKINHARIFVEGRDKNKNLESLNFKLRFCSAKVQLTSTENGLVTKKASERNLFVVDHG
jgi:hypothetical protein